MFVLRAVFRFILQKVFPNAKKIPLISSLSEETRFVIRPKIPEGGRSITVCGNDGFPDAEKV